MRSQVVFLGGSVVSLLITETAFAGIRPTKDVDVIIETSNRSDFHHFEESLRKAGCHQILDDDPPIICRWRINSVVVDVMPCDETILGFSNEGFKPIENLEKYLIRNIEKLSKLFGNAFANRSFTLFHCRNIWLFHPKLF